MPHHHVILRSRIEIITDNPKHHTLLQPAVHAIVAQQIIPLLTKLFSKHVPHDVVIHLDKLVIDVGSLNIDNFKKELPVQIATVLTPILQAEISKVIRHPNLQQVMPLPEAQLQAIAHYLSEGNFAWWMTENSVHQIESLYLTLLHHTPLLIEQLWYNLKKKEKAIHRCITYFSRTTVENTLRLFWKQQDFTPILTETALLLHKTRILTDLPYPPKQQLLAIALSNTLNQQRPPMDRISFLTMLLQQVSAKRSTDYTSLLSRLQAYYETKSPASLAATTTKVLISSLHDMAIIPPKCLDKTIKTQEKLLKALDHIGNSTPAELATMMQTIQSAVKQPDIRNLLKSWLKEPKNRERFLNKLPNTFFVAVIQSLEPAIVPLFTELSQILHPTAITLDVFMKEATLAYCALEEPSQMPSLQQIKKLFTQYFSNTIHKQLKLTPPGTYEINARGITKTHVLPTTTIPEISARKAKIKQLLPQLQSKTLQQIDTLLQKETTSIPAKQLKQLIETNKKHIPYHYPNVNGAQETTQPNPYTLENVVHFLLHNELPNGQSVPAYFIAKSITISEPKQIRHQLTVVCQEPALLKKLMQHATKITVDKLFQAFVPFSVALLDQLETVIIQAKVLPENQTNIPFMQTLFITAAIAPSCTAKQYIARILFYLGEKSQVSPVTLCDQLTYAAKQAQYGHLAKTFALLKQNVASLNLSKVETIDLALLPIHEALEKNLSAPYYKQLLPAIKKIAQNIVEQTELTDNHQNQINKLVAQHLPTLSKKAKQQINALLTKQLNQKQESIAQNWYLFLHTGSMGHDINATDLLQKVIQQLPTFALEQVVDKAAIRGRLITYFTHAQLMLLVEKQTAIGKTLTPYLQSSYQLWCAAQGALGQHPITKHLFWDSVLEILPQTATPFNKEEWMTQMISKWSKALAIMPTTLLQTFKLIIHDIQEAPEIEPLAASLNNLEDQYRQSLQEQAGKRGCKTPILEQLYLLLHGGLLLFSEQYDLHKLESELMQLMTHQPTALTAMLNHQEHKDLMARRIVYYFSQDVTTKIITLLAKDNHALVINYLHLLSNTPQVIQLKGSTWHKELSISTIAYLLAVDQIDVIQFLHSTLLTVCYDPAIVRKVVASAVAMQPTDQVTEKLITLLKPIIKLLDKRHSNHSTNRSPTYHPLTLLQPAEVGTAQPKEKNKNIDSPEEEVRVYTKNSGLIFLWPFLYDFFQTQHLMIGNQFSCDQAAHNAVYLLQYLVTGKLKSPEWQLTLPKLLCGLSYDEVLLPYYPINACYDADGEMENVEVESESSVPAVSMAKKITTQAMDAIEINSQLIIEKAIKRWKSLTKFSETEPGGITPDLFKRYFLNRLGILFRLQPDTPVESRRWHLTIMHQDQDHLNLFPPWSITKIKLPWMQETLMVFWMA